MPFVNYLGWYLCVGTFFLIFSVVLSRRPDESGWPAITNRLLPIGMYLSRVPQYFIVPFVVSDREVTSSDGHIWWTQDIMLSLLLVSIFTMSFMALYAGIRVMRSDDLN